MLVGKRSDQSSRSSHIFSVVEMETVAMRKDPKPDEGDVKCGDNGAAVVITSLRICMVPKLDNSSLSS